MPKSTNSNKSIFVNAKPDFYVKLIKATIDDVRLWKEQMRIGFYTNAEYLMKDSVDKAKQYIAEYKRTYPNDDVQELKHDLQLARWGR